MMIRSAKQARVSVSLSAVAVLSATLLVGCGGGQDGPSPLDPTLNPQDLTLFEFDDYESASELTNDTVVGTWVAISDITYSNANAEGYDRQVYESRREMFVIRETADDKLELASCQKGGFVNVSTVSSTALTTVEASYERDANNVLYLTVPTQSIGNGVSINVQRKAIKILDTVGSLGTLTWDWSNEGVEPVSNQPVFCAAIHHLENGGYKTSIATTNSTEGEAFLQLSTISYPFLQDVYFNDEINNLRYTSDNVDDAILSVDELTASGFMLNFSNVGGTETVAGSADISVTLP